jgi:L-fuculose-phosphate aldolase
MGTLAPDTAIQDLITVGREAYNKNLVAARAGNLSIRLRGGRFIITGQGAPLGFLRRDSLVVADCAGKKKQGSANLSFESGLHAAIYKTMHPGAIVHLHPPFTLTLADAGLKLNPQTFEAALFLGRVPVVPQQAPNVTDPGAVTAALTVNNIVILKNHGVVSIGETIWDAFFLAHLLEEASQMRVLSHMLRTPRGDDATPVSGARTGVKPVSLFSNRHCALLRKVAQRDQVLNGTCPTTGCSIGLKQAETGNMPLLLAFSPGKFRARPPGGTSNRFLVSGTARSWEAVFNGLMDPFTALVQKKMALEGDFRLMLQWYPFFRRLFDLWQTIPVSRELTGQEFL